MRTDGIKIKNMQASIIYGVNLGIREYLESTDAILGNSLFSDFLIENGMHIYKEESTRDIICLSFDFGSRSYEEERKRLIKMHDSAQDPDRKAALALAMERVHANKDLYCPKSRDELRAYYYENGVDITYDKADSPKAKTIHYQMLYRTSAKAKQGQVFFINSKLYPKAYAWLTMGLGVKMPFQNAKIVELSAYAPLTTSTIVGKLAIPVDDVLILKDQESFFRTLANVVRAECLPDSGDGPDTGRKKCVVSLEEATLKNTVWDGMGLIDEASLPDWINGMALLRNHFFKMCGFKGKLQLFFQDWCLQNGHDYDTYSVQDMFGVSHRLKDIKVITTDNAIKWKKFISLMGETPRDAYDYWRGQIKKDGCLWGVVKTDHESKLGAVQQMSYQMINTLPCSKPDMKEIAGTSTSYVERLKNDSREFEAFLRRSANEVNHYEMLADLCHHNPEFAESTWFRSEKKKVIADYVLKLRTGKITVSGDNLTICGNPYALLLYSVSSPGDESWRNDPTLRHENGAIQCCTTRFADQEYLCAIRNPHNSPNNLCYLHNIKSPEIDRYFSFSPNILAVNCLESDIQDRANGCDFDSDFFFVTDQPALVACAKKCYRDFPTIVNRLAESGITYQNTSRSYAEMDSKLAKSKIAIGESSNLAQLAMTYYWTELAKAEPDLKTAKELCDSFITLSVIAQVVIDGCKREYEIDGPEEIKRIGALDCMKRVKTVKKDGEDVEVKADLPLFMKYTRNIPHTKNGRELSEEIVETSKEQLKQRIHPDLICPMNWLEDILDHIPKGKKSATIPTRDFFIKIKGKANSVQMGRIRAMVEDFDSFIKGNHVNGNPDSTEFSDAVLEKSQELLDTLKKMKIGNPATINRLIETALGLEAANCNPSSKSNGEKYTRKMLNLLYRMDKSKFLANFKPKE